MHVLITGTAGFVGQALVVRLQRDHAQGQRPLQALSLLDVGFSAPSAAHFVRHLAGSIAEPALVAQAFVSMQQMVDAIAVGHGPQAAGLVRWAPDQRIKTLFGRMPPLHTPLPTGWASAMTGTCRPWYAVQCRKPRALTFAL